MISQGRLHSSLQWLQWTLYQAVRLASLSRAIERLAVAGLNHRVNSACRKGEACEDEVSNVTNNWSIKFILTSSAKGLSRACSSHRLPFEIPITFGGRCEKVSMVGKHFNMLD